MVQRYGHFAKYEIPMVWYSSTLIVVRLQCDAHTKSESPC